MKKIILLTFIFVYAFLLNAQNFSGYNIFIWDNDNGLEFLDPDDGKTPIGYEQHLIESMENLGFTIEGKNLIVDNILPLSSLDQYAAIFITCGHRDLSEEIFTSEDIEALEKYLDNGGCLYMEGNNIAEYLDKINPTFLNLYFNLKLYDPGQELSYYDTIITDTTAEIFHAYTFLYPSGTYPDAGNDVIEPADPTNPNWHSIMVYDEKGKLYKTTASAYDVPKSAHNKVALFKTYFSTIDMGGFTTPIRQESALDDTTIYRISRTAYIRDVLKFFSLGRILIVNHDPDDTKNIIGAIFSENGDEFEHVDIIVTPGKDGPDVSYLSTFASVIWYTGLYYDCMTTNDKYNLMMYMNYGGDFIISGENFAEQYGVPEQGVLAEDTFLSKYLGIDYLASVYGTDDQHIADTAGYYYKTLADYVVLDACKDPDYITPILRIDPIKPAYYFRSSTVKAPVTSGITREKDAYNTASFVFPIEYINDASITYDLLKTTLIELFGYDIEYISTALNNINISYIQNNSEIIFNIYVDSPQNGNIVLEKDQTTINSVNTNTEINNYKIKSNSNYGNYRIVYKNNYGQEIFTQSFKIIPPSALSINIYFENNKLYIKTDREQIITFYDITGKFVLNQKINAGTNFISQYNNFSDGIYFIKIDNRIQKIIKY